jgi:endo-1,4-beta-xylanase
MFARMSSSPRLLVVVALLLAGIARAAEPLEMPVWPGIAPGSEGRNEKEIWEERGKDGVVDRAVRQVHVPTITVHRADKSVANGVAVLIAPGGGYDHVTIDKEGHDVARWLATQGITGIVLKYRLPKTPGNVYTVDQPLADAVQALELVRAHAAEWGIDPAKLGMMGFSAGGNLTALAGTKPPKAARPAFLAPIYAQIPLSLAPLPADIAPTFIAQAVDDNTDDSIRMYTWVRALKVPVEMHLFAKGGHGFGLGKKGTPTTEWPKLFTGWLTATGFVAAK